MYFKKIIKYVQKIMETTVGPMPRHIQPMIDFTIQIAGKVVAVRALFESTRSFCGRYLCQAEPDFSVEIVQKDIAFEREKSAREDRVEGIPVREFSDAYLETTALLRKIAEKLFEFDTLLFHGSVVAVDGAGYLFTAKSGTGKSTHTRLWREVLGDRAVMVNDDKPFLRIAENGALAYGNPWNGKHGLGANMSVPLKAICILERGTENRIREIPPKEALFMLLQQSNRPGQAKMMPKYMELIDKLAGSTVFYRLECNMDPQAARISYEAMSAERKDDSNED